MKRNLIIAGILFISFGYSVAPGVAFAHDLIPKALTEYVQSHPNATPEEIKAFVDTQDPAYAAKFKNGEQILAIVRNQNTNVFDNAWDFLKIGVGHILSGPDHILFVLSLLLVFVSIRDILKLVTFFTIAHSITLILSGTGLLTVSPSISEPLIAFSIAYVAITSVYFNKNKYVGGEYSKPMSVFFFGLFHGLGFAGLLREIQIPNDKFISSLFAFNIGIEIGQLIIISLAFPFIYFCRNQPWYPYFIKVFSVIIALLALFWVVQRIFFP
jgi:hydrogenase/urease accessory protein HupE